MTFVEHRYVVVTPIYEDNDAAEKLFEELGRQFGSDVCVIAVDDGSVRQPIDIALLQRAGVEGALIKLRRNVGHQRAIAVGLSYVSEKIAAHQNVIVMDSDGEDLPATIPVLLSELRSEEIDVAVARRQKRVETFRFKLFYALYKCVFKVMTGRSISFGNFMAMTPGAVRRLAAMQELSIHVAAAVLASKLRVATCPLDRGPRYAGRSKMNFVGLALHGFRAMMVYVEDVLVRVGLACSIVAGASIVGALAAIVLKLIGFSTPGWFSVALGILMIIFLQTAALTLLTLMLTGVMRSAAAVSWNSYRDLIDEIVPTQSF